MSDSAEGTKPNRRKGNPKPRTGCITCKQRHVKCDEGKPSCQRCIKYGVQCGGYKEDKPKIKPQPSRVRKPALILPKKSGQETASQALHLITQSSPVFQSQANPFQQPQPPSYPGSPLTQEDQTYLQHFRENPAHVLGGYSAPELWTKMVLQACEKEAYILKAVVAVAALDKVTEVRMRRLNQGLMIVNNHSASQEEEARHHQYAVQQYSKAVAEMRESVAQGPQDMQITLLGCLLTVCFEAFHGNHALALQQIRSGVVLIKAWLQDKQEANAEQEPSDPMEEKLLLDEFIRLDLQLMEFASAQTGSGGGEGSKDSDHRLMPNMPSSFRDLNEAGRSLFTLNRQGLNCLARINELEPPYQSATWNSSELSGSLLTGPSSNTPASPAILEEQAHLLQRYAQWAITSKALFPAPNTTPASSSTEIITTEANLLWIRYLVGHITTSLCLSPHEMAWDQFQSSYQQIIDMIRSLFFHSHPTRSTSNQLVQSTFTTLEVFITPLFLVATKCRDPALRHQALELLATCPVREGVLDALMAREVAAWVIGVEAEGMIDGVIGEESRVRGLVVEGGKRDRRAVATCRLPRPGVDGNWIVRRKELAW